MVSQNVKRNDFSSNAFRWIQNNVDELSRILEPENYEFYLKVCAELIYLCALFRRSHKQHNIYSGQFVSHISKIMKEIEITDHVSRKPNMFLPYLIVYTALHECGVELTQLKVRLQSLISHGYVTMIDLKSFQKMDLVHNLDRAGFKHTLPSLSILFSNTLLAKEPNIVDIRLEDVYAITHTIFYLYDFGLEKNEVKAKINVEYTKWIIKYLLGLYIVRKNYDVIGELLLCCRCLNYFPYPFYNFGYNSIICNQQPDGAILGPEFNREKYHNLDAEEQRQYYFEQNYHPTYIATILSFLDDMNGYETYADQLSGSGLDIVKIRSSIHLAKTWLDRIYKLKSHELGLSSYLHLLLGFWIYYYPSLVSSEVYSYANKINNEMELMMRSGIDLNQDPSLILLADGIFRKLKIKNNELERFTQDAYLSLRNFHTNTNEQELNLYPSKFLLGKLDLECFYEDINWKEFINFFDLRKTDTIQKLNNMVARITSYGNIDVEYSKSKVYLQNVIPAYTLYSLSNYNLEDAFALMRSMIYMHMTQERIFKEITEFLLLQQRHDGSVGFYAPEIEKIKTSKPEYNGVVELYLPLTVSYMWTLKEAYDPGFSLFSSIGTSDTLDRGLRLAND